MTDDLEARESFGSRLRQAREDASFTQLGVAQWLSGQGIESTKQRVSAWEKGRNLPDVMVLRRLCRLYNCTADSLLWDAAGDVPGGAALLPPVLAKRLSALPATQRDALWRNLESTLDMVTSSSAVLALSSVPPPRAPKPAPLPGSPSPDAGSPPGHGEGHAA